MPLHKYILFIQTDLLAKINMWCHAWEIVSQSFETQVYKHRKNGSNTILKIK